MAFMTAVGSIVSLLSGTSPESNDKVAIFSDSLNHASIIDGIRLIEKQGSAVTFVYRHCDMSHLDALLSNCQMKKKVVVTDSLFSMDGDLATMSVLAKLRKKHGFLFVIDDVVEVQLKSSIVKLMLIFALAHLSKTTGCEGGFIASMCARYGNCSFNHEVDPSYFQLLYQCRLQLQPVVRISSCCSGGKAGIMASE